MAVRQLLTAAAPNALLPTACLLFLALSCCTATKAAAAAQLNLTQFWLQLPVDCAHIPASALPSGTSCSGSNGVAAELKPIGTFHLAPYFYYPTANSTLVLSANTTGVTTGGSVYPRSELREALDWDLTKTTGTLTVNMSVTSLPLLSTKAWGTVTIAQVKGVQAGGEVELQFSGSPGVVSMHAITDNTKIYPLTNSSGAKTAIPLSTPFRFTIHANTSHVVTTLLFKGGLFSANAPLSAFNKKNNWTWFNSTNLVCFKTGAYVQAHVTNGKTGNVGSGTGTSCISALGATHP